MTGATCKLYDGRSGFIKGGDYKVTDLGHDYVVPHQSFVEWGKQSEQIRADRRRAVAETSSNRCVACGQYPLLPPSRSLGAAETAAALWEWNQPEEIEP